MPASYFLIFTFEFILSKQYASYNKLLIKSIADTEF